MEKFFKIFLRIVGALVLLFAVFLVIAAMS